MSIDHTDHEAAHGMRRKNLERAARIDAALVAYYHARNEEPKEYELDEITACLLTDLRHWAQRAGQTPVDFDADVRISQGNWEAEQGQQFTVCGHYEDNDQLFAFQVIARSRHDAVREAVIEAAHEPHMDDDAIKEWAEGMMITEVYEGWHGAGFVEKPTSAADILNSPEAGELDD